jgi:hypothetical protein
MAGNHPLVGCNSPRIGFSFQHTCKCRDTIERRGNLGNAGLAIRLLTMQARFAKEFRMRNLKSVSLALAVLFVASMMLLPQAKADVWNQAIKFTFNQPVAIPGEVLPAGTYWFQLLNSNADRNIIVIFGPHWKLYATEQTVPTLRYKTTSRVELRFAERPHDQPQALLEWYYPGAMRGHEFVYSGRKEEMLARATKQEVLSSPYGSTVATSGEAVG